VLKLIKCLWKAINDAIGHDGVEHAGYLSFLLMLTIFPFFVFFVALVGFFGEKDLSNILVHIILSSSWAGFIDSLKPRILEITSSPPQGLLTLAILSAIWTASSIFEALRTILNRAYRVSSTPSYLWRRLLSIFEFAVAITIILGFVLILIVIPPIMQGVLAILQIKPDFGINYFSAEFDNIRYTMVYLFTFLLVAYTYYTLPNRKQHFLKMIPGAFMVLLSWVIFSKLFTYYLGNFPQVNVIYGSIAGVIISLLYFYFCSIIFIVGAEFNYQLEMTFYKPCKPK
jgi:membrane protein